MQRLAQVSVEAIAVIAIVMFIFLSSIILINQKTETGKPVIEESKNFAECHKIAETISLVQAAEAITEQTITIENDARMEKNNILIGQTSCNYFGSVEGDGAGITLSKGTIKISKDAGGIIHASQN